MNPDEITDEELTEVFVIPMPGESDEDDEDTTIVFPIVSPEEAAALL